MTTFRCNACGVNWWPYQTKGGGLGKRGACPECGGPTTSSQQEVSPDADTRYLVASRRLKFEEYARAWDEWAMARQAEELANLPVCEGREAA